MRRGTQYRQRQLTATTRHSDWVQQVDTVGPDFSGGTKLGTSLWRFISSFF
jgi:hypothetical protein